MRSEQHSSSCAGAAGARNKRTAASQSMQLRASGSLPMQACHHRKLQGRLVSMLGTRAVTACLEEACGRPARRAKSLGFPRLVPR